MLCRRRVTMNSIIENIPSSIYLYEHRRPMIGLKMSIQKYLPFRSVRQNGMHLISLYVIEIVLSPEKSQQFRNYYYQYRQNNGCGFSRPMMTRHLNHIVT